MIVIGRHKKITRIKDVNTTIVIGVATYLKVGGHAYKGAERPSWGECGRGFPLTLCGKFFIFKNPEVTSDTY